MWNRGFAHRHRGHYAEALFSGGITNERPTINPYETALSSPVSPVLRQRADKRFPSLFLLIGRADVVVL